MTAPLATLQSPGRPRSGLYQIAHRVASRMEPRVAAAFLRAIRRLQDRMSDAELLSAIASGDIESIVSATGSHNLPGLLGSDPELRAAFLEAIRATGQGNARILSDVTGLDFVFDAVDANAVMFAREQSSVLVAAVSDDIREAIRIVIALAQEVGLTVVQQAQAIRGIVGLPPNWAAAPTNLGIELRNGTFTDTRRLSAADKAQIRSRLRNGTITEAFIREMQEKYERSLTNRRALNIARTETLRSANYGARLSWRQAVRAGVLPQTARRTWIVTPDDRLRPEHAAVPGMNPEGVPVLGGAYRTPLGPSEGPPLEVNCRCSEGLVFPGFGVL